MNPIENNNKYQGILYNVSDSKGERKGFLLGSIHFMDDNKFKFSDSIKSSFKDAKSLIVELDVIGLQGQIMNNVLKNRDLINVVSLINKNFIEKMGFHRGVEPKLIQKAYKHGLTIHNLETIDQQLESLGKQKDSQEKIDQNQDVYNKAHNNLKDLIEAAKKGSKKDLERLTFEELSDLDKQEIFYKRNHEMANKLDVFLKNDHHPLIVVGTGHLLGKGEGLIALLRNKGWELTRVK